MKSKVKAPAPSSTLELTASNFDEIVLDDSKDVIVAFTAPCKCIAPAFDTPAFEITDHVVGPSQGVVFVPLRFLRLSSKLSDLLFFALKALQVPQAHLRGCCEGLCV